MRTAAVSVLKLYRRTVGIAFAGRCKYHPSCSQYAADAVSQFGILRGGALTLWRLARCNPLSHGGVDYPHEQTLFRRGATEIPIDTIDLPRGQ
jgi:putative membrane protein insertion efficiency factor